MALVEIDEPYNMCPRFYICNVNHCPLSTLYDVQGSNPYDDETVCTLPKSYRRRIAKHFGTLEFEGLTKKEYAAEKKWSERTDENKENIRTQLKNVRPGKV